MAVGVTKAQKEGLARVEALVAHIRAKAPGPFDAASLSRSYAVPAAQVAAIITKHGGHLG